MKKNNVKIRNMLTLMIVILLTVCVLKANSLDVVKVNSSGSLSNTKIGWGIKRAKDHQQPDVGENNERILNEYQGIYMGNENSKNVYITFDAGYESGYTEKILEVLKQNNVKATFFITAHYANSQPELVQRMIDEGHIIGNHTVNHKSMPDINDETIKNEIMNLHTAIYEKFGYEMKYIRPPKGEYSERTIAFSKSLGYTTVMWSLAYDDWDEDNQKGEAYAKQKILDNIHNGAVILLHPNSKDNSNVLDYCIKEIRNMGYEFKTLDEFE